MMHSDLSRGWAAWLEHWEAKTYATRRLREAANRLHAPELSEAFGAWVAVYDRGREHAVRHEAALREGAAAAEKANLLAEVEELKVALAASQAEVEAKVARALEHQRVELIGSASERDAMRAKLDKEERVELLRRQVTRRMMNSGISRGWTAWVERWAAKRYAVDRLREVGNKLRAPDADEAWETWTEAVADERAEAHRRKLELESRSLETQLRHTRFEASQLDILRVAHEDEIRALKERTVRGRAPARRTLASLDPCPVPRRLGQGPVPRRPRGRRVRVCGGSPAAALVTRRLASRRASSAPCPPPCAQAKMGSSLKEQAARLEVAAAVEEELGTLKLRHAEASEALERAERERREADDDLLRQRAEQTELVERLLAAQRRSFNEDVDGMQGKLELAEAARKASDADVERLKGELAQTEQRVVDKEAELAQAQAEAASSIATLKESVQAAASDKAAADKAAAAEQARLEKLVAAREAELGVATGEASDARVKLDVERGRVGDLEEQLARCVCHPPAPPAKPHPRLPDSQTPRLRPIRDPRGSAAG